ncbi:MAG: hypothetical protein MUP76_05730, partial [Acidimicrobiia bacterium]|nr:hypothetical protein [Acidimicrobiia bacterium]
MEETTVLAALLQIDSGLVDAGGSAPGFVCETVYDLTGSSGAAQIANWSAKPFKVIAILLVAWIVNRLVRRAIDKFIGRLVADRETKATERREDEVDDGRFTRSWQRAVEKANLLSEQAERGKQRTQALGTVLKSVASLSLYALAIMMALAEFGVSLGPLLAGAGIV